MLSLSSILQIPVVHHPHDVPLPCPALVFLIISSAVPTVKPHDCYSLGWRVDHSTVRPKQQIKVPDAKPLFGCSIFDDRLQVSFDKLLQKGECIKLVSIKIGAKPKNRKFPNLNPTDSFSVKNYIKDKCIKTNVSVGVLVINGHPHANTNGRVQEHFNPLSIHLNNVNGILDPIYCFDKEEFPEIEDTSNPNQVTFNPTNNVFKIYNLRTCLTSVTIYKTGGVKVRWYSADSCPQSDDTCHEQVNAAKVTVDRCKDDLFIIVYTFRGSETQNKTVKVPKAPHQVCTPKKDVINPTDENNIACVRVEELEES